MFDDYAPAKTGFFFGIGAVRLGVLALGTLPVFGALSRGEVVLFVQLWMLWLTFAVVLVVPVFGRSVFGWFCAMVSHCVGGLAGWTLFRSRAARGEAGDLSVPDLPGVLAGVRVHEGPPRGATQDRVAVLQDHAARTWVVTAAVVHPGLSMASAQVQQLWAQGLAGLLDVAQRSEVMSHVIFQVRTVPDDGAERALWVSTHTREEVPALVTQVTDGLEQALQSASVRTEAFVSLVMPDSRIAREARQAGRGVEGRARVVYRAMGEMEAHLRGSMGMTSVEWLTSPELALACRTGFAPGDRASVVAARAERALDPRVNAEVPWGHAGPSGADTAVRHYSHDAWQSISATLKLPVRGTFMGALGPALTPATPGERRSFAVVYPVVTRAKADRKAGGRGFSATTAGWLRGALKMSPKQQQIEDEARARAIEAKVNRGSALSDPYAVVTVTVPNTFRISEAGHGLDASIRRCGFAPLRLDLSQDVGFAVSSVPMGITLAQRGM